ncbi:bifunctional folylpolyglutamate synthase/dihydrofolate synthase [Natronospora cellulosivora (SeqCode)]
MNPYKYINSFVKFGSKGGYKPGLERMKALLNGLDNPEDKLNIIHVAGSNGKGSTIAYLKSIYKEAGYKVGVYTSPHLLSFNERIEINGQLISDEDLKVLISKIKAVIDNMEKNNLARPSFFELVTTLAFLYFAEKDVDILLLEVGLGGRLDATNVIKSPLASVITSISLEHTAILGDTLGKIAREKAGIIKGTSIVITGVREKEALNVIAKIAKEKKSQLSVINELYEYRIKETSLEGQVFSLKYIKDRVKGSELKGESESLVSDGNYEISLLGDYQVGNAILAMEVINKLLPQYKVSKKALINGLQKAYIPGRLELIEKKPIIILDGAHNPDGMEKLASFIMSNAAEEDEFKDSESFKQRKIYMIFAVLKDKDLEKILKEIKRLINLDLYISKNNDPRALDPSIVKEEADSMKISNQVMNSPFEAFNYVKKIANNKDIIIVSGSFVTVAEVKKHIEGISNE